MIFSIPLNKYILDALSMFGKLGVHIFVMISGYFVIDSMEKIPHVGNYADSPYTVFHCLLCVIDLFTVCAIIDILRIYTSDKIWGGE